MKKVSLLLFTAFLALAAPAFADEVLLSFYGYDYENIPDPHPATYLAVGDDYVAVGFVATFHPIYLEPYVNESLNEYTLWQHGLVVDFYSFAGNQVSVTFTDGGRADYYEDSSKDATNPPNPPNCPNYGINPPNADAPSKFNNGTLALGGLLTNAYLYFNYTANTGGFSADMTLDSGSYLTYVPTGSQAGWFMSGLLIPGPNGDPCPPPAGYEHNITGTCRQTVVPTTHRSWGTIKSLYRH
jgi:hypothetical protein